MKSPIIVHKVAQKLPLWLLKRKRKHSHHLSALEFTKSLLQGSIDDLQFWIDHTLKIKDRIEREKSDTLLKVSKLEDEVQQAKVAVDVRGANTKSSRLPFAKTYREILRSKKRRLEFAKARQRSCDTRLEYANSRIENLREQQEPLRRDIDELESYVRAPRREVTVS